MKDARWVVETFFANQILINAALFAVSWILVYWAWRLVATATLKLILTIPALSYIALMRLQYGLLWDGYKQGGNSPRRAETMTGRARKLRRRSVFIQESLNNLLVGDRPENPVVKVLNRALSWMFSDRRIWQEVTRVLNALRLLEDDFYRIASLASDPGLQRVGQLYTKLRDAA